MAGEAGKKQGCCTRCPGLCSGILIVTAVVSLAGAAVLGGLYPKLHQTVDKLIESNVALTPDSPALSNFKSSSAPLYMYYYFFNVTNPDDVENKGAAPNVVEVGPFAYVENRTKSDLTWNDNETEMSYALKITYTFDESRSQGNNPNTTVITTVNVPLIGIALMLEKLDKEHPTVVPQVLDALDWIKKHFLFKNDGLFIKRSVSELLFGYQDPLLTELLKLAKTFGIHVGVSNVFNFSSAVSYEGPNTIHTGKDNLDLVGQFIEWNNQTKIEKWGSPAARQIRGTGGFMFHPGVTRGENLTAFISELFRSGYFSYVKDVDLYGVHLLRFGLPSDELKNTSQDPGFYPNGPSGVLNLTAVFPENIPLFASKPHFLGADPGYTKNVTGLHPDPAKHDSHLDIEPLTGAALSAAKRIQMNLRLQRYKKLPEIANIPPNVMLPVFYACEEGGISQPLADEFKEKVYSIEYGILGGIFGVIGVLVLVCVVCVLCLVGLIIQQWKVHRTTRRPVVPANDEYAPLLTAGGRLNTNI